MYCPFCGSECREGAKFCTNCGSKLEEAKIPEPVTPGPMQGDSSSGNASSKRNTTTRKRPRFSQAVICARCGQEFYTRTPETRCPECESIIRDKEMSVEGYLKYLQENNLKRTGLHNEQFHDELIAHRERILESHKYEPITEGELCDASVEYRNMSMDQAVQIVKRARRMTYMKSVTCVVGPSFFMSGLYEGSIVDGNDIFAVGLSWAKHVGTSQWNADKDFLQCLLLSNDRYMPAVEFYLAFQGERFHRYNAEDFKYAQDLFSEECRNLTYPVQALDSLQKQIAADGQMRGDMDIEFAENQIAKAMSHLVISAEDPIGDKTDIPDATYEALRKSGYMTQQEVFNILFSGSEQKRRFWERADATWLAIFQKMQSSQES